MGNMNEAVDLSKSPIGQSLRRREDKRFITGNANYTDDVVLQGQTYGVFLRSPHAHARIRSIDLAAAKKAPGVVDIITGADLADAKVGGLPCGWLIHSKDGAPMKEPAHPVLAQGKVRHVGDQVALVVAETLLQAKDAAELIVVDYEELPAVIDLSAASSIGSAVHDDVADNTCYDWGHGDKGAVEAAFAKAAHVTKLSFVNNRLIPNAIEPRAANAAYNKSDESYTLYVANQNPHVERLLMCAFVLGLPESKVRVIAPDVGGGFGSKIFLYPEDVALVWASKRVGRPIKWTAERSESFLTDAHGRDHVTTAELAMDKDGNFLALRVKTIANMGAYLSTFASAVPTILYATLLAGQYKTPAIYAEVKAVFTNTAPVDAYRGAGRPEATYVIERLIDDAARELGRDPVELRRINLIPPQKIPYKNAFGLNYDSGNFPANQKRVLELADWDGFPKRREDAKRRGKLRGIGLANPIEKAAGPGQEFAEIRFHPSGNAMLLMGSKNQGQGHETVFKQILNERLGLDPAEVQYIDGDTDRVAFGIGTNGSRSTVIGGSALWIAADKIIAKGKRLAAHLLEAAEADIEFAVGDSGGNFAVAGTDRRITITEVAKAAFQIGRLPPGFEGGLFETGTFSPSDTTYPNGSHVCEVEIDPDTGELEILNYVVVDDVGTVVNPIGLKGQIHGGVAQGLGQAVMEEVVYDRESGQLLSGSFMDYAMPRAEDFPYMSIESNPCPTKLNPLGAKGAGEAGTVGALPAIVNAVLDALAPLGVNHIEMPTTSQRIWQAMQAVAAGC
jgi:aerobic carbon-monoxide dehydrogenase large subunit